MRGRVRAAAHRETALVPDDRHYMCSTRVVYLAGGSDPGGRRYWHVLKEAFTGGVVGGWSRPLLFVRLRLVGWEVLQFGGEFCILKFVRTGGGREKFSISEFEMCILIVLIVMI